MEDNLEKCLQLEGAISQRKEERARGLGDNGTAGYEIMGCYTCDGLTKECPSYIFFKTKDTE